MNDKEKQNLMEDADDEGLKAVMGSKFQDKTKIVPHVTCERKSVPDKNPVREVQAKVFSTKPGFFEKLRECGKWSLLFGGLCLLVFYWQQTGQMMPSAAVPCMMACTGGACWCVGRACR